MRAIGLAAWLMLGMAFVVLVTGHSGRPDFAHQTADITGFGARGDGVTDDWHAIQKTIDLGAGEIRFPKGVFRISKPLRIDLDKIGWTSIVATGTGRLLMAGAGPALSFVGTHGGTADPPSVQPRVWDKQRMPMIDGLEIVGAHAEADGIRAEGTMQLTISRSTIRDCRHAIHLTGRNRNLLIADCHIYKNHGVGIYYDHVNLHQSNIVGCHVSYCAQGGIVSRGGEVRNIHIGTCDIESNMAPDTPATANILLDSTGGSVAEVAITGCTIQHNSKSPNSANIRIRGQGDGGKRLGETREGHVTIADNVFSDVRVNVHVDQARGVSITGNTFWMGYDHNLLVENSSNVVVGPNVFDRNPRYDYGDSKNTTNDLVFRACRDCTLTGLHVNGVYGAPAGVTIENCRRFLVTGCTILDCDKVGLLVKNLADSRITGCLIRDDRQGVTNSLPMQIVGGSGNYIGDNTMNK